MTKPERKAAFRMLLSLSDRSPEPLHRQLSRQIRALILADRLGDGDMLPSIRAMAREQKVSVITVQRAYEDLEQEGLVHTRRGKGFFVSSLPEETKAGLARSRFEEALRPLIESALQEGLALTEIRAAITAILKQRSERK